MQTRFIRSIFSLIEFPIGWIAVLGIALLDALWMSHIWLKLPSVWHVLDYLMIAVYAKGLYRSLALAEILTSPRAILFFNRLTLAIEYIALYAAAGWTLCTLSYLACAMDYPVIDQELNFIDHAIGFNWLQYFHLCLIRPIKIILQIAYASILPQLVFFTLWFGFLYQKDRLNEIFWILFVALGITILVSAFLPALGPASALGIEHLYNSNFRQALADSALIRSGANPDFSAHSIGGIIVFPSFHTAAAIIYAYGFRKSGIVGHIILLLNIAMLLATPTFGDHYLADMLAGAGIAMISIVGIRLYSTYQVPDACLSRPKNA